MKKSMGASKILKKVYALYISTNNNDGIALNGLGQLFHDLCIGDNHLTISDLGKELPPCCFWRTPRLTRIFSCFALVVTSSQPVEELLFHRNIQKEEQEFYLSTGKQKILRRLTYDAFVVTCMDLSKLKYIQK